MVYSDEDLAEMDAEELIVVIGELQSLLKEKAEPAPAPAPKHAETT